MINKIEPKTFGQSVLFNKFDNYEKELMQFIMTGNRVDTKSEDFADVKYDIKRRQVTNSLMHVVDSDNVVLVTSNKPLSKAFKVFAAKDIKTDNKVRVFVDCSTLLAAEKATTYRCTNIDMLISYLADAMITLIYHADPNRLIMNYDLINSGAKAFSSLFTNIIDYLYKISIVPVTKSKVQYLASMYFIESIGQREVNSSISNIAIRYSDIETREAEILDNYIKMNEANKSLYNFIHNISEVFKFKDLTVDVVVEKWMYLYGPGTVFALELFPNFAHMMIDTYVGSYINNQKTIEKVAGKDMIEFTKTAFKIGESVR